MREIILLLAEITNIIHDVLLYITGKLGLQLTDKDLHFWIIGPLGIVSFLVVYACFRFLEKLKWSTGIFSFIYTFTIMVVIVFAIEIQQAITNRGNMEFADAVIGLWGFLVFFMVYAVLALGFYFIKKQIKTRKKDNLRKENDLDSSQRKFRSKAFQK